MSVERWLPEARDTIKRLVEEIRSVGFRLPNPVNLNFALALSLTLAQTPVAEVWSAPPQDEHLPKDLPKGKIVFASFRDNNPASFDDDEEDIYLANLDGGGPEKLTKKDRRDRDPRVMSDGRVVFASLAMSGSAQEQDLIIIIDPKTKKEEIIFSTKSDEALPLCPASDKDGNVVFHMFSDQPAADIYSAGQGGKVERLTQDSVGSSEECPVVSPDGRFIAFEVSIVPGIMPRGHDLPSGIAIYRRDSLSTDFEPLNHPVLLDGGRTYRWLPDSEYIIYSKGQSLYKAKWDGSEVDILVENAFGGSLSPDGKWILFASRNGKKNANLYIIPSSGGTPIRLWETPDHLHSPQWLSIETGRKQIALVPGMLNVIEGGIDKNGGFSSLRERLAEPDLNYRFSDYFVSGYMGGRFDERGYYYTNDQTCEDTLQGIEKAAQNEAQMVLGFLASHKNDELIIVAQSLGGPVMLRAFELIKSQDPDIDLSRVKLITTNSPNQGVDKFPLEIINQLLPPGLPPDCYITAPIIGPTPPPQVFDYPTMRSLLEMWDIRGETQKRWLRLTSWMKSRGGQIVALANFQDCVIAIEMCASRVVGRWPWDIILPPWLSWVDDPWFYATLPAVLWTQEIPGATNIWRALGNDPNWGHTKYLDEGEGLETLAAVIGKQKS